MVTLSTQKSKLVTSYKVKSPILELNKITELHPIFLKELTEPNEKLKTLKIIESIRQEYEDALKENLSYVINPPMEIHYKIPEFIQKFLTHYEEVIIFDKNDS